MNTQSTANTTSDALTDAEEVIRCEQLTKRYTADILAVDTPKNLKKSAGAAYAVVYCLPGSHGILYPSLIGGDSSIPRESNKLTLLYK